MACIGVQQFHGVQQQTASGRELAFQQLTRLMKLWYGQTFMELNAAQLKEKHMTDIEQICDEYDVDVIFSMKECTASIVFKDGKKLVYALSPRLALNKQHSKDEWFNALGNAIAGNAHGRAFKDGKFIGYAPEKKSLDEILIAVDMMTC